MIALIAMVLISVGGFAFIHYLLKIIKSIRYKMSVTRDGRAEYARLTRMQVQPEVTEAEFIADYARKGPKLLKSVILAIVSFIALDIGIYLGVLFITYLATQN